MRFFLPTASRSDEVLGYLFPIPRLEFLVNRAHVGSESLAVLAASPQLIDEGARIANRQNPTGFAFVDEIWPSTIGRSQDRQPCSLRLGQHHRVTILDRRKHKNIAPLVGQGQPALRLSWHEFDQTRRLAAQDGRLARNCAY